MSLSKDEQHKNDIIRSAWNFVRLGDYESYQNLYSKNRMNLTPNSYVKDDGVEAQSLLQIAAYTNSVKCIRALITAGADLYWRNFNGYSALHFAALSGSVDAITELFQTGDASSHDGSYENKLDVNCRTIDGKTPLHLAASRGNLQAVNHLINYNRADVNACDSEGYTPIFFGIIGNHRAVVEALLNSGADAFHMTADKQTPKNIAEAYGRSWFKPPSPSN